MLDRNVQFIDLDPVIWNRIGDVEAVCIPDKVSLHVLLDHNMVINAWHDRVGTIRNIWFDPANTKECVQHLFDNWPDVDEVWLYEQAALIEQYKKVHSIDCRGMDIDVYNSMAFKTLCATPGIDHFSREGASNDFLGRLRAECERKLPRECCVILIIFKEGLLFFNAVIGFCGGKINLITTLEHFGLPQSGRSVIPENEKAVCGLVAELLDKPVIPLFWEWNEFLLRVNRFNAKRKYSHIRV